MRESPRAARAAAAAVTVAVSGLGAMQPGMPVVRALRKGGFAGHVIGLSYDLLDPANYEPGLVERTYLMPYPNQGSAHLLERLLHIHRAQPIDVLLPTLDAELPLLCKLEPALSAAGIRMLLPSAELLAMRSKARLPELSAATGIAVPHTRVANGLDAARAAARELPFPFLVKGQYYGAARVYNMDQFEAALTRTVTAWGLPVVLQEIIDGVEFDVVVLGSRDGELLGAVPMKKLALDGQGKAWGGITVADAAIDRVVEQAMAGLAWRGLFELELIRSRSDGEFYLIEINPRVPAWVALAVAAGQNLPWALLRLALGEEVAPFATYTAGIMTLRQCVDLTCPMPVYEALAVSGENDHRTVALDDSHLPRLPTPGRGPANGAHEKVQR